MITRSSVCADASLLIKLAITEADSASVDALWERWATGGVDVFAPVLIMYEFVSAVRQGMRRSSIRDEDADTILDKLLSLPITLIDSRDLHRAAHDIARELDVASAYDAHYLALALSLDCEFWTADERLYNAIHERFPLIRWLGVA